MKQRMVLEDIAKALGVSKTTVSRAISGTGRVSEETRRRVLDYVNETGFIPNASASNLSMSRTKNLAFSMPLNEDAVKSSYFLECLFGVCRTAREKGYNVIVVNDSVEELTRIAGSQKVDGLVLSVFNHGDAAMEKIAGYHLPVVLIGMSNVPGVKIIGYDARSGFRKLTSYLLENWKIRLGLILTDQTFPANQHRAEGFQDAMTASGEMHPRICWNVNDQESMVEALTTLYREGICGVICGDDSICSDILYTLDASRNSGDEEKRRMADTIRLASFHSNRLLQQFHPEIPTVVMEPARLGEFAAHLAILEIEEGDMPPSTMLDYTLHLP